jgi:hypothetical protein
MTIDFNMNKHGNLLLAGRSDSLLREFSTVKDS